MQDFFAMGGYAVYVWPSFGIFLLVLLGNLGTALWRHRQIRQRILDDLKNPST